MSNTCINLTVSERQAVIKALGCGEKTTACSILSRKVVANHHLTPKECAVIKLILRSLNRSKSLGICFTGPSGIAPKLIGGGGNSDSGSGMEGGSTRERTRFVLRDAWNGAASCGKVNGVKVAATPFRAVNNAGDLLNRQYYTSGGSNQVKTGRIRSSANQSANVLGGSIFVQPDSSGVPSASTNVKYVYDGSDYTKFKKQQAVNRNYNDYSFGGAGGSNTFIALNRVRR